MSTTARIEPLDREECLRLLAGAPVGRVVFTHHALPAVLLVTVAVDDGDVILRTARGSRLAVAAAGAVVAVEVDDVDVATRTGWSVVATGQARVVDDPADEERLDRLLRPWAPGRKSVFLRVPVTVVSGRRVSSLPLSPRSVPLQKASPAPG